MKTIATKIYIYKEAFEPDALLKIFKHVLELGGEKEAPRTPNDFTMCYRFATAVAADSIVAYAATLVRRDWDGVPIG